MLSFQSSTSLGSKAKFDLQNSFDYKKNISKTSLIIVNRHESLLNIFEFLDEGNLKANLYLTKNEIKCTITKAYCRTKKLYEQFVCALYRSITI